MSITLTLPAGERRTASSDTISIGSAASCQICVADQRVRLKHATIRKVAGKWIVEAEGDGIIKVDDGVGARKCWLTDGCEIHLTESGPTVVFEVGAASQPEHIGVVAQPESPQPSPQAASPPPLPVSAFENHYQQLPPYEQEATEGSFMARNWFSGTLAALAVVAIAILYGAYTWHSEKQLGKALEFGNQHWENGERDKAVAQYERIKDAVQSGERGTTVFQRLIEYRLERGERVLAEALAKEASARGVWIDSKFSGQKVASDSTVVAESAPTPTETADRKPTLSDEFLPPQGRDLYYETEFLPDLSTKVPHKLVRTRCKVLENGRLQITDYQEALPDKGAVEWSTVDRPNSWFILSNAMRLHNGFIEIGGGERTAIPMLKVDAKAGDSWTHQTNALTNETFSIAGFLFDRSVVVVHRETAATLIPGNPPVKWRHTMCFAKEIGLLFNEVRMAVPDDGYRFKTTIRTQLLSELSKVALNGTKPLDNALADENLLWGGVDKASEDETVAFFSSFPASVRSTQYVGSEITFTGELVSITETADKGRDVHLRTEYVGISAMCRFRPDSITGLEGEHLIFTVSGSFTGVLHGGTPQAMEDMLELADCRVVAKPTRVLPRKPGQQQRASSPHGGRPLIASVNTAGKDSNWRINRVFNPGLKSVKAYATEGQLIINFDVDDSDWEGKIGDQLLTFLIRVFDKNGEYLTHFTTKEGFTTRASTFERRNQGYERATTAGAEFFPKPVLLEATSNRLVFSVNARDLRDAAAIEIGFVGEK